MRADGTDVRFDYDGGLQLARELWSFADELETVAVVRHDAACDAQVDWLGLSSDRFGERVDTETRDLHRIATDLRTAAQGWAQAWADALNLQNRRLHARACDAVRDDRSNVDKVVGWVVGHDDLPAAPSVRATPQPPAFAPTGGFARYPHLGG